MSAVPKKEKLPNFHMVVITAPESKNNYSMIKLKALFFSLESVFTTFVNSSN